MSNIDKIFGGLEALSNDLLRQNLLLATEAAYLHLFSSPIGAEKYDYSRFSSSQAETEKWRYLLHNKLILTWRDVSGPLLYDNDELLELFVAIAELIGKSEYDAHKTDEILMLFQPK